MLFDKTVAVVVPAYNEERQIGHVLSTMPDFVDRIIVVNDCSKDNTAGVVMAYINQDCATGKVIGEGRSQIDGNKYDRAETLLKDQQQRDIQYYAPS
jgi:cellulose synthase/poly-beta-1,6-N-acetylglucosamine synthase-like glycosyltransferase